MSTGNWLNNDGLWLQYGVTKAIPDLAGDYVSYGPWRELEAWISPSSLSVGNPGSQANTAPLPTSFQGTIASQTATANTGIISYTTLFPLQPTAPVTASNSSGVLTFTNPQLYISTVEWETFIVWANGGGSLTGITGVGLVCALPVAGSNATAAWAQITPNAGVQLMQAATIANSNLVLGRHYTWYADGTAINLLTPAGTPIDTNYPTAPAWMGNVPLTTLAESFLPGALPNNAYISAIVSGGAATQSGAGGLSSLRVRYRQMYAINDSTQI